MNVALVTGASSGIGEAIAGRLLDAGWQVFVAARRVEKMSALADRGAHILSLDLTDDASMQKAVAELLEQSGNRLDALVNNAGYGSYGALEDVPIDEARRQFEVNLFGLARLTQLVLPTMREQHSGRIVNISSMGAHIYEPLGSWYHATKFAVNGLSDSLRLELAPFGIKVVTIQPGSIRSEWAAISAKSLRERSGQGAYAKQAKLMADLLENADASSSDPRVVADAVFDAVSAPRPRSKYTIGAFAKPMVYSRRLLPDALLDPALKASFAMAAKAPSRLTQRFSK